MVFDENDFDDEVVLNSNDYYSRSEMSRSVLCDLDKMTLYKFYCKHISKTLTTSTDTPALYFGRAFHTAVLEPHKFNDEFAVAPKLDKRTKAGKEAFAEFEANSIGKDIISSDDNEMLNNMLFALGNHPASQIIKSCELKEAEFYFELDDVDFRAKLDCVNTQKHIIFDVKTTKEAFKNMKQFSQEMINHHNAEQVYIYSQAYQQKYGERPKFYFICIEKAEPFEIQIIDASALYEYGYKKTHELISKYKSLKEKYGDSVWLDKSIQFAELPNWANNYINGDESYE